MSQSQQLPQWKCHKVVRAAKILTMTLPPEALQDLPNMGTNARAYYPASLELEGGFTREVEAEWMTRNRKTAVGGYFVEYDDGYTSYSPAHAFETGYTKISEQAPQLIDGFPRRQTTDLLLYEELAIRSAVAAVERMGADPVLTEVVMLLDQARERLADYVESQLLAPPAPMPANFLREPDAKNARNEADFRERVRQEKRDLDDKMSKLLAFTSGKKFATLSPHEQRRLTRQLRVMADYSGVLAERIGDFPPMVPSGKLALDAAAGTLIPPVAAPAVVSEEDAIEAAIQAKNKTAPRVTPAALRDVIAGEYYATADRAFRGTPTLPAMELLTICVLVLRNGFTVIGHSACASPENFDAEIGRTIARQNAEREIWPLLGYELKERLHRESQQGVSS
jgi:hypothetical protein